MQIRNEPQSSVALMMGLFVGALGTLVLVGWMFNLAILKSVFPGLVSMKANTAMGMLLCGGALAILAHAKVASPPRFWPTLLAGMVIAVGALILSEYLFGWELGIDQWLFRDADYRVGISQAGRMSPATAFCFVLTGVSLLAASQPASMRLRRSILAAQGLALIIVSGLAFVGYASDALFNLRWWSYTGMAVHTAAGFMLLGFGLLALGRGKGQFKWSLDALTTGGFVISIASLLGAAGIAYHFTLQLQESAGWVSHTQEVLKEIGGVAAGVASIGSSQRSYINMGDDRFLEKEAGIKGALHQNIASLRKLTADNPRQQPRLDQLDPLVDRRIDWGEQTIAARRKEGLSAAEQMIATGKGIALTDSIRRVISALEDEEYSLLDERQKKEKSISSTTFLLLPLGVFLSVTLLSLGLFVLNTGMGERARAQEKAAWLASFPERNPSHIVELDLATGLIHYLNPFTLRFLPDLQSQGLRHPWLAGLQDAAEVLLERHGEPLRREIAAGGRFYAQTINYIPETKRVRVYGNDITERQRAEAASARLAAIVESSDDAIIGKDLQGKVTSWNAGAERMFGYPACEMVGQPIMRLIPPDRQQEEMAIQGLTQRGESVRHFDTERVCKDGSTVPISVTVSPIKDSTGRIVGGSKVARDITERKRAEEALRASEARYRMLFDYAPDGIVIVDSKGYYVDVNASICRMLGYTRDEFIGLNASDIVAPEEIPHIGPALDVINTKSDYQREWQFRRKDGSVLAVDTIAAAMPDGTLLGMIRDITERKQAQEALSDSEERFRTMANSIPQLAWIARADGRVFWYNRRWYAYTGTTPDQMEGWGWQSVHEPSVLPKVMENWKYAIESGKPFEMEFPLRGADGRFRTFLTLVQPLTDSQGRVVQWFGTNTDVETIILAKEQIRQLNTGLEQRVVERTAELQSANQELEAFSYSVSHDLRAPLRHVTGFVRLLQNGAGSSLSEENLSLLTDISEAATRMGVLIDDLLAFSRVGKSEIRKTNVNLADLVRETLGDFQAETNDRKIAWEIGPLPDVWADPALLRMALVNLISNAVKFTGARAQAKIKIEAAPGGARETVISIRDNGAGFDPQYAGKLFGVFQRLHDRDEFEGTGIGLANVQRIIHRHGGRTWAEGMVDRGATFYFSLPKQNGGVNGH